MKKFKSIISEEQECLVCKTPYNLEKHHIFFGTANRKLSEKYHLVVYLCMKCHRGQNGVHFDKDLDTSLKQLAQRRFEIAYPDLDFRSVFGKSFL